MQIESRNPTSGAIIETYTAHSPTDVEEKLGDADRAQREWKATTFEHRSQLMREAAALLRGRKEQYGHLMALEMGKPVRQGQSEVEKCASVCDYYAEHAESFLLPEPISSDAVRSWLAFEPLGLVLAVMPWNFPFWQVFRFAAPALMAGNAGVLKHASNVPGCALEIETVFRDAGFPPAMFQTLLIGSSAVAGVIEDARVSAVTLTGSTPAGRAVAQKSGFELKKTVLELGGSDPYLILDDTDLESTAASCAASRLINGGQSCIAAKRFIVLESIRERFEQLLVAGMRTRRMGDPLDEATDLGPMARHDLRDELHEQVRRSVDRGGRLLLGGEVPKSDGAFYPPTVLTGVRKGMPAYDDELFGPVAGVISVADEDEAVRVANDTIFGLGSAVFTSDDDQTERVASRLDTGCCFINGFVRSDPRLPFGGIKQSGYGRELSSFGIREFVNIKTIYRAK